MAIGLIIRFRSTAEKRFQKDDNEILPRGDMTVRTSLIAILAAALSVTPTLAWPEPLTLLQGLSTVTEQSRIVRIRQQEEKMSQVDTAIARSRLLPSANVSFGETVLEHRPSVRVGGGLSTPTAEASSYTYQFAIRQIVYDFGGASSLYKAAKLTEETNRLETQRTRNVVALDFSILYFDVLQSEKLITVSEKEVESLEAHARVARELLADGLITRNELLQAEVRLADARQKLLNAQNMRKICGAMVNNMLTRPLSTPVEVVELARDRSVPMADEEAATIAEKERPELQVVDVAMRTLQLEETARRSEYFPQFFAQGQYDYTKNKYTVYEGNAGITLLMKLNLFNGESTKAEIKKLQAAQSRLRIEGKRLADEIRLELQRYYLELANARERVTVAERAISQAEENLRITRLKYSEGLGIASDVTDAIALRALSETNYYRALYDWYRSEARYLYAMGKNLEEEYRG
jgi:outer membrane protein